MPKRHLISVLRLGLLGPGPYSPSLVRGQLHQVQATTCFVAMLPFSYPYGTMRLITPSNAVFQYASIHPCKTKKKVRLVVRSFH